MAVFQFGHFTLDSERGDLKKDGVRVEASYQVLKILTLLVERKGMIVSHREIESEVWSERNVNLTQSVHTAIRGLRAILGDDPKDPVFIETVPREGYRFLAKASEPKKNQRRLLGTIAACLSIGLFAVMVVFQNPSSRDLSVPTGLSTASEFSTLAHADFLDAYRLIWDSQWQEAGKKFTALLTNPEADVLGDVGLGLLYLRQGQWDHRSFKKAEDHLLRAMNNNPDSAYANAAYAKFLLFVKHDGAKATNYLEKAQRLDFRNPEAQIVKAFLETAKGRTGPASEYARLASDFHPGSVYRLAMYGIFLGRDRKFKASEKVCLQAYQMNPENYFPQVCLLFAYWRQGNFEPAKAIGLKLLGRRYITPETLEEIQPLEGEAFLKRFWEVKIDAYEKAYQEGKTNGLNLALAFANVGKTDEAIATLKKALKDDRAKSYFVLLTIDPHLDALRTHPDFLRLMSEVGISF